MDFTVELPKHDADYGRIEKFRKPGQSGLQQQLRLPIAKARERVAAICRKCR
jgi:hypothetical protein